MTSPFAIEEIFPDDTDQAVRLPRRQAGNSPQGLAVTLLADYTVRTRARLPSAALVALLTESGASPTGARTAISRLVRRGVLDGSREGRRSFHRLSREAAANLSAGGRWILTATATTQPWDGYWTLVAFSLPQDRGTQRRSLRGQLRWLGYAPLYDGLWISPHDLTPPVHALLTRITPGAVTVFRAHQADLDTVAGRDPLDAWDVAAIGRHYGSFLDRWRPLLPRVASGQVTGAEAVRTRTEVMDTFRRFPVLDPRLPAEILPAGWLRQPAREVFAAVYDGLARPAEQHVRAVVRRFADGVPDDVRAHTTAELLAGIGEADATETGSCPP
ncbi:PaaX family transcriptional regulator C-terminal domain-containing protein [Micromonospora cathayae]|uniref:PaaX family transcriptional regulator C-terminal domain-containing protein n=1 Tax=Micromonospora cathayae TaxID=3028804 RepID=A0ABY7ZIP9_9ACTN|nr:PaaX family transcriptional regulator C-terminal domain-containing protein [Micromonospora sp. HUAS 3]WDZ82867.1 PaaX family transcriptional regulator C-terminal domain-containing protein [Micromonospora sp. HUAS 3]